MIDEPELTFDALRTRKPKRGTCLRCWKKPTAGILQMQAAEVDRNTSLISLTTSMCLDCIEIMYRAIATAQIQPVVFGDRDHTCPRCQKNRPVIGRIVLMAKETIGTRAEGNNNPKYTPLSTASFRYCESCTVYMFRNSIKLRDQILEEGSPITNPAHS